MIWREEIGVQVMTANEEYIDIQYDDPAHGIFFRMTLIYVPATYQQRIKTWERLKLLKGEINLPWVWMGDFNETLYFGKKWGEEKQTTKECRVLASC